MPGSETEDAKCPLFVVVNNSRRVIPNPPPPPPPTQVSPIVAFRGRGANSFTFNTDFSLNLAYGQIDYDVSIDVPGGSNFDGTTFTAPIKGLYHIDASFTIAYSGAGSPVFTASTGVLSAFLQWVERTPVPNQSALIQGQISGDVLLQANQTLAINLSSAGASGTTTAQPTTFTGFLITDQTQ